MKRINWISKILISLRDSDLNIILNIKKIENENIELIEFFLNFYIFSWLILWFIHVFLYLIIWNIFMKYIKYIINYKWYY